MKNRPLLISLASLSLALPAAADIFVMKDGNRLEATILKETADSYHLEVQITKSIRDEKTVPKSEVAEIITVKPDAKAFESIRNLAPMPDLMGADEYTRRLAVISKFIADHPKSDKIAEAEAMAATLKADLEVIAAGGIKMDGKLISGEEYQADLYDTDAKILEARIKDAANRGDVLGALRLISRMDADFKSTNSRANILPLKKKLLAAYKAQIDELVTTLPARQAERDAGLARMSRDARVGTEQALKDEMDQAAARFQADMASGQLWKSTHPFHEESLVKAQETVSEEMIGDDFERKGDAGKIYRNILKFIAKTEDPAAIRDAVYQGEDMEIPEKYLKNLKEAATAKGATF